jgi:hypothetical protein
MRLFDGDPWDSILRGRLALAVQIVSLCATGGVIWITSLAPRLYRQSLGTLVAQAFGFAALACLWSALITFGCHLLLPLSDGADMVQTTLRTATAAVWFAPATILLTRFSPAAIAAALVLVVSATRVIYLQWRQFHPEPDEPEYPPARPDALWAEWERPSPLLLRQLTPALSVSLSLQAGMCAILLRYPLLAAALCSMGAALLTVFALSSQASDPGRPPNLPRSVLGVILTVLLAAGLTVGGSPGLLARGSGGRWDLNRNGRPGFLETARRTLREILYDEKPAGPSEAGKPGEPPPTPGIGMDDSFPGVILWPEVKPVTTLVAPVPVVQGFSESALNPLSIQFSGQYWMYRWPYHFPPHGSFFRRGSPAELSFSTTDHSPLQMEARHKLDQPIDLRCCGRILLNIWNEDRYPGTVLLELLVDNTDVLEAEPQSLGRAPVISLPNLNADPVTPVPETLEFRVPATLPAPEFNEFRLLFHRNASRGDKSARIEIDRFVLVPRGR